MGKQAILILATAVALAAPPTTSAQTYVVGETGALAAPEFGKTIRFSGWDPFKEWEARHGWDTIAFARDGGVLGTLGGPYGNTFAYQQTVLLGMPERGTDGSPRLDFERVALIDSEVVVRSAYLTRFMRVESLRTDWRVEVGARDTWPSAFSFMDAAFLHGDTIMLSIPDFEVGGASTFERNGHVFFGLGPWSPNGTDTGGCFVSARFEADALGAQTVHVGRGCTVIARQATLQRFVRYPGAGLVLILADPCRVQPGLPCSTVETIR